MLLNNNIAVGFYCSMCEHLQSQDISMFELASGKSGEFICSECRAKIASIIKRKKTYSVNIMCSECGNEHTFLIRPHMLWSGRTAEFKCPLSECTVITFGKKMSVEAYIEQTKNDFENLYGNGMFGDLCDGCEDDFVPGLETIFNAFNELHNIVHGGRMKCSCGCSDMEITTKNLAVTIKCRQCGNSRNIFIGELEDPDFFKKL